MNVVCRVVVFLCLCLSLGGCVQRLFLVRTPGHVARVYFNGEYYGQTGVAGDSVAIPFKSYGKHQVVLRAEGCLPREDLVQLEVPWFATFPLDLFTEVLIPFPFVDQQERVYQLAELSEPEPHEELFYRADALRQRLRSYTPEEE